jgi:two-component system, response regulator YesN
MSLSSVLVVDDEYNSRMGVSFLIEKWSKGQCEVMTAENGQEALKILEDSSFDLLITDIKMPVMTGIELLEELRSKGNEIASILLTGFAEFEYAKRGLQLGAIDYLMKPIQQEKLIIAVEKAMELNMNKKKTRISRLYYESTAKEFLEENPKGDNEVIESAMHYINTNLHTPLAIKDVAKHVHLNPSYFSVLFKDKKGVTFSDFVTRIRIKKAKELLFLTDLGIDDISEQVGYQTTSYFIRIFKKFESVTPKKYREAFKENKL